MAITLTLNNLKEAKTLLLALEVQHDIADDTVLEDLYMQPSDFRRVAQSSDDEIDTAMRNIRKSTDRRITELQASERLLNRVRDLVFKMETHS